MFVVLVVVELSLFVDVGVGDVVVGGGVSVVVVGVVFISGGSVAGVDVIGGGSACFHFRAVKFYTIWTSGISLYIRNLEIS